MYLIYVHVYSFICMKGSVVLLPVLTAYVLQCCTVKYVYSMTAVCTPVQYYLYSCRTPVCVRKLFF